MPFDLIVRARRFWCLSHVFLLSAARVCLRRDSGIERWTHKLCAFFSLSSLLSSLRRLADSFQTNRISGGIAWMDTTIG